MDGLLPPEIEDFKRVEFWNGFFKARPTAFEWYLGAAETVSAVEACCGSKPALILHAGCGNSDISALLADRGHVTINFDYSRRALVESARPKRKANAAFVCADILNTPFRPECFDVVVDKGLHDAMMTCADEDSMRRSRCVFGSFSRALIPRGKLLLITLAQEHILALVEPLETSCWAKLRVQPQPPERPSSPLLPFCFTFEKRDGDCDRCSTSISFRTQRGDEVELDHWAQLVENIRLAQESFAEESNAIASAHYPQSSAPVATEPTHTFFVVDVKPEDFDTDLLRIRELALALVTPSNGLKFVESSIEPIGFGISKLVLRGFLPLEFSLRDYENPISCAVFCFVKIICSALEEIEGALSADLVDIKACSVRD